MTLAMSAREQGALLNRIVWGGFYASVLNAENETNYFIIKELTLKDRGWVDFIYQQAILEGKAQKLMPESELAIFLSEQGIWTARHNEEVKNLKKAIANLEDRLTEDLSKRDRKKIERTKELTEVGLRELTRRRGELFSSSLESYAEQERLKAIIFCSAYTIKDRRYWVEWDDFENETDKTLIDNLLSEVAKSKEITTEQFRFLARSNNWRFKWQASKNCDDLFGKPIVELSGSQESLIYWSQVYDSVYEAYERPSDDIINDDEALDEWFEEQSKQRKRERVESQKNSKRRVGSDNIWKHGEVGIVVNPALQEDLDRAAKLGIAPKQKVMSAGDVNELNTELSKKFLAAQRNKLKEHGILREQDIRADANSRRVISSTDAIVEKRKRSDGFTGKSVVKTFQGGTLKGRRINE